MASKSNADLVKQIYAAFGRGDIQGVLDLLAEDVDWFVPGGRDIPYAGARRGREQVAQFFKLLGETTEIDPFEPREFIAQGDQVAVVGFYAGRAKPTGRPFKEDWVMVFTFKGGKVVRFREFMDPSSLSAAFGSARAAAAR